jgi:CelD/BcsL family acetyltransferase involved in cellulose biosynthesis
LSELRVEKVLTAEHLDALRAEWNALAGCMRPQLPFVTWEWATSWWRHFKEDRAAVADSLSVRTVRSEAGELVAVAPLMLTERPRLGPFRVRRLHLFGADPNITEIRRMPCRPGMEEEVHCALLQDLKREQHTWDELVVSGILGSADAILATPGLQQVKEIPDYVLALPPSWETFRDALKRNTKESLRKCYKSLARDGLGGRLTVLTEPDRMEAGLEQFFRLHAARAAQTGTVTHDDVFRAAPAKRFLVEVCRALGERGVTRLFLLEVGDRVVAARVGFAFGDELYLYYSGYEPAYARYSIMTTLVAEVMKWAIASGITGVNLSTGTDASKTRWRPQEIVFRDAVLVPARMRARLAHSAAESALVVARSAWIAGLLIRIFGRRLV